MDEPLGWAFMAMARDDDATVQIRAAGADEVGLAAAILEDAIAWAAARGHRSWTAGSFADPRAWGWDRLRQAQVAGGLHLICVDGRSVGTLSLLDDDPRFWPGSAPDALYLHRFAIRGSHAGRGLGAAALAWADAEVLRRGRRYLRLDCLADEPGIRAHYERVGFAYRADVEVEGLRFALYEREATGP